MKKIEILLVSAAALMFGTFAHAGDIRVWTSRKGTLEGSLLKADLASATIVDKAGKQTVYKMEEMSIADRQYIVQYEHVDPKILAIGTPGQPEREYRLDEKTFVKEKDKKITLGTASLEILTTEHFVIAHSGDVRPQVIGEAAERIWYGMAFQHMDFRKDWGDLKLMIMVDNDRKSHEAVGKWYFQYLKDNGRAEEGGNAAQTWDEPNLMTNIEIPKDIAGNFKVKEGVTYFNATSTEGLKKAFSPGLIHSMAGLVMNKLVGGFSQTGAKGSRAIMTGHDYYKEYTLTGEITTGMVNVTGTDNKQTQRSEAIRENWPKVLKTAVKKGDFKPSLAALIELESQENQGKPLPAGIETAWFGLSYYMQSSNLRLAYYSALVQRISTGHAVPVPEEIAKFYGFSSVADFDADWKAFIESSSFK